MSTQAERTVIVPTENRTVYVKRDSSSSERTVYVR
jgi:hypothetical protein